MRRAITLIVLNITAGVILGASVSQPASSPTSKPVSRRILIRAAFDRINRTGSYFPEMDALKDMVTPRDLPLLYLELSEGHNRARRAAAWILAHVGSPESADPLCKALASDQDPLVRWEAAHTLGHIGAANAETTLIRALQSDPDWNVRARAADALNMLGTPGAMLALRKAAGIEKDPNASRELKFLLGNIRYRQHRRAFLRPGQVSEGYFKGTRYLVYTPQRMPPLAKKRWLVIAHATWATPEPLIERARSDAERYQVMILAPHFDYGQYSWFGMFNLRKGKIRPDLRVLEIVDDLSRGAAVEKRMLLFGQFEGGQFVHRFVLAHPDRVERAVAVSPGMLVSPDPATPFPTGTGANPLAPDLGRLDFSRLVQTRLGMMFGTDEEASRRQKMDAFLLAVQEHARKKGTVSRVESIPVPDTGSASNWLNAREFLLDER